MAFDVVAVSIKCYIKFKLDKFEISINISKAENEDKSTDGLQIVVQYYTCEVDL